MIIAYNALSMYIFPKLHFSWSFCKVPMVHLPCTSILNVLWNTFHVHHFGIAFGAWISIFFVECTSASLPIIIAITINTAIAITILVAAPPPTICHHHHWFHAVLQALMYYCGLERINVHFYLSFSSDFMLHVKSEIQSTPYVLKNKSL